MTLSDPRFPIDRRMAAAAAVLSLLILAACSSTGHRAPVEVRKPAPRAGSQAGTAASADTAPKPPLPGAENAGKPGYYTVQKGDTLIRIGLDYGQPWRDIARWNELDNANVIEVGQVLRVVPPTADANGVSTRPVTVAGRVESRPLDGRTGVPAPPAAASPVAAASMSSAASTVAAAAPATAPTASTAATAATAPPTPSPPTASAAAPAPSSASTAPAQDSGDDTVPWAWPAGGAVFSGFDEGKTKGLSIAGKAGDPVLAAADGRVVYAGSGLRGYGNLVIIKHNATYLSAYAHNQTLLVKEDQAVRRGQKIAEMGSSDADRVQLHFEVRRMGKPIDPARLLPPR